MKKLLLVSTAVAGVALLSAPASAALKMDLGGYFRGYGVFADNNETAGAATSLRGFEFRRDSEVHVNGETTLDNGLTVGAHTEFKVGNGSSTVATDEVYGYASGGWGRVNLGVEDGAAYLLQVAAPSADSSVDGLRTYIQGLNATTTQLDTNGVHVLANSGAFNLTVIDYDHADNTGTERLTYLSPKFNGFQGGVSYAPRSGFASNTGTMGLDGGTLGLHTATGGGDTAATYDSFWELAARWDGEFQGVGVNVGGGWSHSDLMLAPTIGQTALLTANDYYINDDVDSWNAGLAFSYSGFTLGGSFMRAETGRTAQTLDAGDLAANVASGDITRDTWVVGLGYDNGPYHVGASYLNQQTDYDAITVGANAQNVTASKHETTKYAVGGGYTFGPGMTFRGAVTWGEFEHTGNSGVAAGTAYTAAASNDFTQVTVGTDIQF